LTVDQTSLSQIEAAIAAVLGPNVQNSSNASDIFESYIFTILLDGGRVEGGRISFRDVFGNVPQRLVFRSSPGYIFSTMQPYTHAVIEFDGKPSLEAHLGVRVAGKSDVLHECDLAVIDQVEAETCRRERVSPRSSKVVIAVECKFYATSLQLGLGRSFMGLVDDLSAKNPIFVTNSSSESIEKLLSRRRRNWERNVNPSSSTEVSRLRHFFQESFKKWSFRIECG
jgi:hypothetical protein